MRLLSSSAFAMVFSALAFASSGRTQPAMPNWEPVTAEIHTGNNVRVDLLTGADCKPVMSRITVTSTYFDMGPHKMEMLAAPVRVVGIVSFDANVTSSGHSALTVFADVAGQTQSPGKIVFTAAKP